MLRLNTVTDYVVFNQNHTLKELGLDLKTRKRFCNKISFENKDSYRWVESVQYAHGVCHSAESTTVIADREADIYEALHSSAIWVIVRLAGLSGYQK